MNHPQPCPPHLVRLLRGMADNAGGYEPSRVPRHRGLKQRPWRRRHVAALAEVHVRGQRLVLIEEGGTEE